jgi:predicted phage terminase large subunit-like protein
MTQTSNLTNNVNTLVFEAQQGKQEMFLSSTADIVFYGGAAGGGKTFGLLLEPLRFIDNNLFKAIILRRTYSQIEEIGAILDDSKSIYPHFKAKLNQSSLDWTFESGAVVGFGHLQHDKSVDNYLGARIPLIMFDQLEQFTERQFWGLVGRNSSVNCEQVKAYIRATMNPDPDSFIVKIIRWWIDDSGYPIKEHDGIIRYFIRSDSNDDLIWFDSSEACYNWLDDNGYKKSNGKYKKNPKSFTFISATIEDNPAMLERDPDYEDNLNALQLVDRMQKLHGNWKIKAGAGNIFNRNWFNIVYNFPKRVVSMVRAYDRAGTVKNETKKGHDPDYTGTVLIAELEDGRYIILDAHEFRDTPHRVLERIKQLAIQDVNNYPEVPYQIALSQDPASAGIYEANDTVLELAGYNVYLKKADKSKVINAKPVSIQCERSNISVIQGEWTDNFLNQLHGFPDLPHDDMVDALSLAFKCITENNMDFSNWL